MSWNLNDLDCLGTENLLDLIGESLIYKKRPVVFNKRRKTPDMMMQAKFKPRKQQNYKKISFYLLLTAYNI